MTSTDLSAGFQSLTREVVDSFLQTVVILDDLAQMSPSARVVPESATTTPIGEPQFSEATGSPDFPRVAKPEDAPLDAEAVIGGFADIGSVCAVLNPGPDDEFQGRIVKAAHRADIVILDWKIHESYGGTTIDVMHEILEGDEQGRRLRLIVIYTAQSDFNTIFDQVRNEVEGFYEDDELIETPDFRLSKGPLNVVILAKQGTIGDSRPELKSQEVAESDLADRLSGEFALMIGGLIQNAAISGISAIRDNAHRILAKFEHGLDPAYLGHRLLLQNPPDAEDHLVEALGSEVASILEEHRPGAYADIDAIESWLTQRESEGLNLDDPFDFNGSQNSIEGWRTLLLRGANAPGATRPTGASNSKLSFQAAEPFAKNPETALRSNRRFAALLNLKTRYPGEPPRLSIGTLLREDDEDQYLLCLQPKCDSIRLSEATGFPFIRLILLEGLHLDSSGPSLQVVVEVARGQWRDLGIVPKPSELSIRSFEPEKDPPRGVVALEECPGVFYFEDSDCKRYLWVAQLKDEHALRVAGEVASALIRPGPNDAEWLRRAFGSP